MKDSTIHIVVTTTFACAAAAVILALVAGCSAGGDQEDLGDAEAQIESTGAIDIAGEGDFEEEEDGTVSVEIAIEGAPPGSHGVHIHETGDCGNAGMNAGDHWNPEGVDHGMPGSGHLGDLGNLSVDADGVGMIAMASPAWSVGDGSASDLIGKAVIIHAGADDFGQPTGNAGERIACGVIEVDAD